MPVTDFPPLTHVALTVRDLSVSIPWYEALFDAKPVLDEDTDPDFHHTVYLLGNNTLLGLHQHARPRARGQLQRVPGRPRPRRLRLRRPGGA
jgi:catechol 2,3-dioxygenase-like lactoylglutathione lyase family enzyme